MSDVGTALAIWASLEGLHFSEAHCVAIFTKDERAAIFQDLRKRLKQI